MKLPINDLSCRLKSHQKEIEAAISRVLHSGWVILGPSVRQFEADFAEFTGAGHCVGVGNGTDAIELALRAMGISSGDRVATVANAGMYTTTALVAIGAEPFFVDVDLQSQNVSLIEVERAIHAGVKAVVVTHLFGRAVQEIEQIARLCVRAGVFLLEDCAQAHGARINRKNVGTFGDAGSFSFYPTKNLGAIGDGGAVVSNSAAIAEKVARLRQYGWASKYQVTLGGARNSRLDELQAAILSSMLPYLDESNARRRRIAAKYCTEISNSRIMLAPTTDDEAYVAHLFVVRTSERESLRNHLSGLGIATEIHYPIPDYKQPVFADRYEHWALANTDHLAGEILTLPCFPEMTEDQIDLVITGVNSWTT